jgi:hypothetical protein
MTFAFQLYEVQDCYKDYADCNWNLDYQRLDPFKIIAQVNLVNYCLELSPAMPTYLVFYVSPLKSFKE